MSIFAESSRMAIGKNGAFIGSARICWKLAPTPSKPKMRISFFGLYAGLKNGKPWMWSECACVMKSESFIDCAWNSSSKARPSGRMPEPASSTTISPSARTSTHVVFPPYRSVPGPGTAIEPRVPQNLIRTGDDDAETLGMGWQNADVAMHFQLNQAFLGEYLESASLEC